MCVHVCPSHGDKETTKKLMCVGLMNVFAFNGRADIRTYVSHSPHGWSIYSQISKVHKVRKGPIYLGKLYLMLLLRAQ